MESVSKTLNVDDEVVLEIIGNGVKESFRNYTGSGNFNLTNLQNEVLSTFSNWLNENPTCAAIVLLSIVCFQLHSNSVLDKSATAAVIEQVRKNIWTLTNISYFNGSVKSQFPILISEFHHQIHFSHLAPTCATLRDPKGFGPSPKKRKKTKKLRKDYGEDDEEEEEEVEEPDPDPDQGVIPEVVTNRMISRMAFSVGIPLGIGLLFFPFFYYLKVGLKIDVPTWVPFIVSSFFFGFALLGVSYGIVSSSWDPLREGSLQGWNEAHKNWPVFWQSLRGGSRKN